MIEEETLSIKEQQIKNFESEINDLNNQNRNLINKNGYEKDLIQNKETVLEDQMNSKCQMNKENENIKSPNENIISKVTSESDILINKNKFTIKKEFECRKNELSDCTKSICANMVSSIYTNEHDLIQNILFKEEKINLYENKVLNCGCMLEYTNKNILKEDIDTGKNKYIENFNEFLKISLNRLWDTLVNFSELDNKLNIDEIASIRYILYEVSRVKNEFIESNDIPVEEIYENNLRQIFTQFWNNLNENFVHSFKLNNFVKIKNLLDKVKKFIIFDCENFIERKFCSLHDEYSNMYYTQISKNLEFISESINNCHFKNITSQLSLLKMIEDKVCMNYYNTCINKIYSKAEELFKSIISLSRSTSNNIEIQTIDNCVKNIKYLRNLKIDLNEYIDENFKNKIDEILNEVSRIINFNIQQKLKTVSYIIENNYLVIAETKINEISNICNYYLLDICNKVNFEIIREFRQLIETKCNVLIERYKTLPICEYYFYPPEDIINKVKSDEKNRYNFFILEFNKVIFQKFNEEINTILAIDNSSKIDTALKTLSNNLKFVSEDVRFQVEETIKISIENYRRKKEYLIGLISSCIENLDYKQLLEIYNDHNKNNEEIVKIKTFLDIQIIPIKNEISENMFNPDKLEFVIDKLSIIEVILSSLNYSTDSIKDIIGKIRSKIFKILKNFKQIFGYCNSSIAEEVKKSDGKEFQYLLNEFMHGSGDKLMIKTDSDYKLKDYRYIIEFLLKIKKNKKLYNLIIDEEADKTFNDLIKTGIEALEIINEKFKESISCMFSDIILIKSFLDKFKKWHDDIFYRFKKEKILIVFEDIDIDNLSSILGISSKNKLDYKNLLILAHEKLSEIYQNLIKNNLMEEKLTLKNIRNIFYDFKKQFYILEDFKLLKDDINLQTLEQIINTCKSEIFDKITYLFEKSNTILQYENQNLDVWENYLFFYDNLSIIGINIPEINISDNKIINIKEETGILKNKLEFMIEAIYNDCLNENNLESE